MGLSNHVEEVSVKLGTSFKGIRPIGNWILVKHHAKYSAFTFANIVIAYNSSKGKQGVQLDFQYTEVMAVGENVSRIKVGDFIRYESNRLIPIAIKDNEDSYIKVRDRISKTTSKGNILNLTKVTTIAPIEQAILKHEDVIVEEYTLMMEYDAICIYDNKDEILSSLESVTSQTEVEKLSKLSIPE